MSTYTKGTVIGYQWLVKQLLRFKEQQKYQIDTQQCSAFNDSGLYPFYMNNRIPGHAMLNLLCQTTEQSNTVTR